MHAPIGHQPARIIPKPAEIEVKSTRIERNRFSWTEPSRIINARGWCSIRNYSGRRHPSLVAPNLYRADIAQLSALHKINRILKMLLAALPLARLHYFIVTLLSRYHRHTFADRIADGFFDIYIFPGFASMYHN